MTIKGLFPLNCTSLTPRGTYMKKLVEGLDYYYDAKGCIVLTAAYHEARGYCCGHGCRHCPFDFENVPTARRKLLLQEKREHEKKASQKTAD